VKYPNFRVSALIFQDQTELGLVIVMVKEMASKHGEKKG
jgi:hypothetical protein